MYEEINQFINKTNKGYVSYLQENINKYKYYLGSIEYFYYITNFISYQKIEAKGNDNILFSIYSKAALDLYGIYYCLKFGLEIQANTLLRSLYENFIDVNILFEKPNEIKERIKLYHNFIHIKRGKHILSLKEAKLKYPDITIVVSAEEEKLYLELYEKYKEDYEYNKSNPHWAGKIFKKVLGKKSVTLYNICEYFGEEYLEEYLRSYSVLSISVHNNPVLKDYYSKEDVVVNSPKYTDSLISTCVIAIDYCSKIIIPIIEYIKPERYLQYISFINKYYEDFLFKATEAIKENNSSN